MHFVKLQNLKKHRTMDMKSFTLIMTCFSPLPLSQSRTLTSGMEVSLSTLRLSLLLGPGPCIPLSSAVKRFWVWLIDTEQRQCYIGSPP